MGLYEASMLVLTVIGVVGILVYSYKLSHSQVYVVGIVHKLPIQESLGVVENRDKTFGQSGEYVKQLDISESSSRALPEYDLYFQRGVTLSGLRGESRIVWLKKNLATSAEPVWSRVHFKEPKNQGLLGEMLHLRKVSSKFPEHALTCPATLTEAKPTDWGEYLQAEERPFLKPLATHGHA